MRARVDFDHERDPAVHRHGERLRAAHAAEAGGHDEPAGQRAAEVAPRQLGERFVRALQDALGADVDPAAGRHLSVHREPAIFEIAETLPRRPGRHEQRVGDEHARRPRDACGRRRRAFPTARRASRRARVGAASRRWRRTRASCAPRVPIRRRRRDHRDVRRRQGRGCSSACGAQLPEAILCR